MQCPGVGCSEPAVIAVHQHFHISRKQCRCRGCSAAFCVPEGECSAHAVEAVSLKVYAVFCDRGCSAHEGGCSVPAVVAGPRHCHEMLMQCLCSGCTEPLLNAVHLYCNFSCMQCPCRGCSAAFCVPAGQCSAHAVNALYLEVYAVCFD